jgi:hypothetical protein
VGKIILILQVVVGFISALSIIASYLAERGRLFSKEHN